jgi:hypothetical protein
MMRFAVARPSPLPRAVLRIGALDRPRFSQLSNNRTKSGCRGRTKPPPSPSSRAEGLIRTGLGCVAYERANLAHVSATRAPTSSPICRRASGNTRVRVRSPSPEGRFSAGQMERGSNPCALRLQAVEVRDSLAGSRFAQLDAVCFQMVTCRVWRRMFMAPVLLIGVRSSRILTTVLSCVGLPAHGSESSAPRALHLTQPSAAAGRTSALGQSSARNPCEIRSQLIGAHGGGTTIA